MLPVSIQREVRQGGANITIVVCSLWVEEGMKRGVRLVETEKSDFSEITMTLVFIFLVI